MENTFDALRHVEARVKRDYIYLVVALLDMIIGLFLVDMENPIMLKLGVFMFFTGLVFASLLILQIYYAGKHVGQWNDTFISAYRHQNGLPLLLHEQDNIIAGQKSDPNRFNGKVVYAVRVTDVSQQGGAEVETKTESEFTAEEIPNREFIIACFKIAMGHGKWHVPERSFEDKPEFPEYQTWLATLEQGGIFKRADARPHSARVWQIEKFSTLDLALAAFGYAPPTLDALPHENSA